MFDSYTVALLLLVAPTTEGAENLDCLNTRIAMQQISISMQILDKREVRYNFARPNDFKADLNLVRKRYQELKDAPFMEDLNMFGMLTRDDINTLIKHNVKYKSYLNDAILFSEYKYDYVEALKETEFLYEVWDALRDAKTEYYYVTVRRKSLEKVRNQVGYRNFYNGYMPPYVPIWRFNVN